MLRLSSFGAAPTVRVIGTLALVAVLTILALLSVPRPSSFFGAGAAMAARNIFGNNPREQLRVRLVAHGIPSYDVWLAANRAYLSEPNAPAVYPPEAGMHAHREIFFVSPAKDKMFYILFFESSGEDVIRAAFAPDSEAWKAGEEAGILVKPVSVKHLDADALFPDDVVLPELGEAFVQPEAWPETFPSIDGSTLVFDCPVDINTGKYKCR